ncbi:MAG: alpha/beta fold hydrolase, partial [Steroidobacteraceae bacterium]
MTPVLKGFVDVPHGQVHFRHGGSGPPVVVLHDTPRSSLQHVPVIEWLGEHFTVIALDAPGAGNSTPLPAARPSVEDFAAALATTLDALGIERCALYGLHAGACTALHFAADHPERAALTVLDGLPSPEVPPTGELLDRRAPSFEPTDDGGYLAGVWSRILDVHRYDPWFRRAPETRLQAALPDDLGLHEYAIDLLTSGASVRDAERAALGCAPGPAIARLSSPTVFLGRDDDPPLRSVDRLPQPLPTVCRLERVPHEIGAWRLRILQLLRAADLSSLQWSAPVPAAAADGEQQRYVNLVHGQVRVRLRSATGPASIPVLLLHDAPGSSAELADLAGQLSPHRPTIAPDLPGLGESTPLPYPSLGSYVSALSEVLDELQVPVVDIVAQGLGTSIAVALAANRPAQVRRLALDAVAWIRKRERGSVRKQYCPPLEQDRHGAYLQSTWHQLRDAESSWPWFDRSPSAARVQDVASDPSRRHAVLVDVLKQLPSYGDAARAALEAALKEILPGVRQPVLLLHDARDTRYRGTGRALKRLPHATQAARPATVAGR